MRDRAVPPFVALLMLALALVGCSGCGESPISHDSNQLDAGVSNTNVDAGMQNEADAGEALVEPKLKVSVVPLSDVTPMKARAVQVGTRDVAVLSIKLEAENGVFKVRRIPLKVRGKISYASDISNVRLYLDRQTMPFASSNQMQQLSDSSLQFVWVAADNVLPDRIRPESPVIIRVVADIGPAGQVALGDTFRFFVGHEGSNVIEARDVETAKIVQAVGAAEAVGETTIVPFDVSIYPEAPVTGSSITMAVVANTQVARFKVVNSGSAAVEMRKVKFTDSGQHTGSLQYRLLCSSQNQTDYVADVVAVGDSVSFSLATHFMIDGGAYRYLTPAISQMSGTQSGDFWQLSVAQFGDLTYSVKETDLGYDCNLDGRMDGACSNLPVSGTPQVGIVVKQ